MVAVGVMLVVCPLGCPGRETRRKDLTRIVRLIISDLIRSDEKSYAKSSSLISYTKSYQTILERFLKGSVTHEISM